MYHLIWTLALILGCSADVEDLIVKIVGGKSTAIHENPYMASIQYFENHRCGGAIITEKFVLTAAHCTVNTTACGFKVRVGTTWCIFGGQFLQVDDFYVHPNYDPKGQVFDSAILRTVQPIVFSYSVQPIPLDEGQWLAPGTACTISGWGTMEKGGSMSFLLKSATVSVVDQVICAASYTKRKVTYQMMCAGDYEEGGKDSCQGDSGGPLICAGRMAGIVSWGNGCARKGYPGVYTRVCYIRDFIKQVAGV